MTSDALVNYAWTSIRKGSKSFAAAAVLFEPRVRDDVALLYAWCRHADDVIDGQTLGRPGPAAGPRDGAATLAGLERATRAALSTDDPVDPPFEALRTVARRHDLPLDWPLDLITGFAMDVNGAAFETVDDTIAYAYHVAGVVGLMMARILGVRHEATLDRACDLGIAFQLTNIARDVMQDRAGGRTYLPGVWLREAGAADFTAADETTWPEVHGCAVRLLAIADRYYASSAGGLSGLSLRSASAVASAARIYRAIGEEVRRRGPAGWRGRVSTAPRTKAAALAGGLADALRSRAAVAGVPRDGLWTRARSRS